MIAEPKAIIFFILVVVLIVVTNIITHYFHKALRQFEMDADLYDHNMRKGKGPAAISTIFTDDVAAEVVEDVEAEADGPFDKRRPYRIIVEKLNKISPTKLNQVSARSKTLQYLVKVPMVFLVASAATVSGCSVLLLKIVDTIL